MASSVSSGKVHTTDRLRPYKQDLPPKGGYSPINFKRIPARQVVNGKLTYKGHCFFNDFMNWTFPAKILFGGFIASNLIGLWDFLRWKRNRALEKVEMQSAKLALEPMLQAERDRAFLKHARKLREYEAELMKDVPGWEVGTWFGQRLYPGQPEDL